MTCDFKQCDILTSIDSDEHVQPPFRLKNLKWCSVSSLILIGYSSDKQRLWSDCAYAQADLRLCWSHIPNSWKSHALAQIYFKLSQTIISKLYFFHWRKFLSWQTVQILMKCSINSVAFCLYFHCLQKYPFRGFQLNFVYLLERLWYGFW